MTIFPELEPAYRLRHSALLKDGIFSKIEEVLLAYGVDSHNETLRHISHYFDDCEALDMLEYLKGGR